jgi:hypothetical protein
MPVMSIGDILGVLYLALTVVCAYAAGRGIIPTLFVDPPRDRRRARERDTDQDVG